MRTAVLDFLGRWELKAASSGTSDAATLALASKSWSNLTSYLLQHRGPVKSTGEIKHLLARERLGSLLTSLLSRADASVLEPALLGFQQLGAVLSELLPAEVAPQLLQLLQHTQQGPAAAKCLTSLLGARGWSSVRSDWQKARGFHLLRAAVQQSSSASTSSKHTSGLPLVQLLAKVTELTTDLQAACCQDAQLGLSLTSALLSSAAGCKSSRSIAGDTAGTSSGSAAAVQAAVLQVLLHLANSRDSPLAAWLGAEPGMQQQLLQLLAEVLSSEQQLLAGSNSSGSSSSDGSSQGGVHALQLLALPFLWLDHHASSATSSSTSNGGSRPSASANGSSSSSSSSSSSAREQIASQVAHLLVAAAGKQQQAQQAQQAQHIQQLLPALCLAASRLLQPHTTDYGSASHHHYSSTPALARPLVTAPVAQALLQLACPIAALRPAKAAVPEVAQQAARQASYVLASCSRAAGIEGQVAQLLSQLTQQAVQALKASSTPQLAGELHWLLHSLMACSAAGLAAACSRSDACSPAPEWHSSAGTKVLLQHSTRAVGPSRSLADCAVLMAQLALQARLQQHLLHSSSSCAAVPAPCCCPSSAALLVAVPLVSTLCSSLARHESMADGTLGALHSLMVALGELWPLGSAATALQHAFDAHEVREVCKHSDATSWCQT